MEAVILLMTIEKTNRAYYVKVNVDVEEKNMIHINNGIKINVFASVKTIIYLKKIVKMENISQVLWMLQ